ncbi:MAG: hypothetical protein D4R76_00300 [Methylococcus sp.]|nr:MAG: hypothetical protein D4R76_00300 [Methylococcus sp.]
MVRLLASVAHLEEAEAVVGLGVDILDLKNPNEGALGAWSFDDVRIAVDALKGQVLSATIGDLPMRPDLIVSAVRAMALCRVHYVKLGFFQGDPWGPVLAAVKQLDLYEVHLVAVLLADHPLDLAVIRTLRESGFSGVMLDTADKSKGSLRHGRSDDFIGAFVEEAHAHSLLCGLAGSLTLADIEPLSRLGPDYLGFRGALCDGGRTQRLNPSRLMTLKAEMERLTDAL